jgi:imidazolonepropionase-like amidohydrolase
VIRALALALLLALLPRELPAQTLVIEGTRVHTMGPAGTLDEAVVIVRDGRIAQVGETGDVTIPDGATRLRGAVVTPGLIDTHSVAGLAGLYNVAADQDVNEATGPNQAGLRAIDAFNPREPLLRWLLEHGVTVVQSGPGEANPIGGLAGVFRTHGDGVESMTLAFPSALIVSLGETPKATYAKKEQRPTRRSSAPRPGWAPPPCSATRSSRPGSTRRSGAASRRRAPIRRHVTSPRRPSASRSSARSRSWRRRAARTTS